MTKTASKKTPAAVSAGNAATMDDLLAVTGYQIRGFKRGDKVTGKVIEVTGRTMFIDIGGKAEAVVSEQEFDLNRDYFKAMKPGDEVNGMVLISENDAGQVILSLRRAAADAKWKSFEEALEGEKTITVVGKEITRGGLLVDADGVYGFVPTSQMGRELEANPGAAVGRQLAVKVVEVDRNQNRLVLSERAVSEAEEIEKRREVLASVSVGGEYDGTVVGVVPFGAFVGVKVLPAGKLGVEQEVEGLVHVSEISWEKVEEVGKFLKEGDKVKVQVIGLDEESGKLALSMKRLLVDPWTNISKKYTVDSKHKGVVTRIVSYGVLIRLEKGIEGLIHASKMPAGRAFAEGEEVEVFVESVDLDKRRLSLGVVVKDTKGMIYK